MSPIRPHSGELRPHLPAALQGASRSIAAGLLAFGLAATALPGAVLATPGSAQSAHHHRAFAVLSVPGEGQSSAEPDEAQVSVGVSVQAPTATEAMAQNAELQSAVIEQLMSEGVEARDIQTAGLNLSPVQDYLQDGKPPVVTGYSAQNMVTIRVRDLSRLGDVLDKLVESGANQIHGISFSRSDTTEAENEARVAAIETARERAEVMARAAGGTLGPLMSLSDSVVSPGPHPMMMMNAAREARSSTPIQAGELTMSATVSATYALIPAKDESTPASDDEPAIRN